MIRVLAPLCFTLPLFSAFPSPQEALALTWPGAQLTRKEHYLTNSQAAAVRQASGVELPGLFVVAYEVRSEGRLLGVAFFDSHRVRTLNETAMVAILANGTVKRVEVVAFREPLDYLARPAWIKQLEGKTLNADLNLKRGIRPLAGATLTAHALVDASRRCLALFKTLYEAAP